ncbi:MAG: FAD-dependent oxidoreductase, partial [Cellvibrionaceae bacterium]|nr:FAD-dependent oxidoreductase [Cellvibrionaceae bacterium]
EFAGIFHGLGAETHQLYRGPMFLRGFDDDLREFVANEMQQKGVNLHFNTDIEKIDKNTDGSLKVSLNNGEVMEVDCVMYATGRRAKTQGLGLETTAVEMRDNGSIVVDENYRSAEPSIYALGDVIGGLELTPVALAEGMALAHNLFGEGGRVVDYDNIPTAVFSQPNIATVGLSEIEARKRYDNIDIYKSSFKHMKHTLSGLPERTFMKLVVDKDSDKVLGAHMVGSDAGEIIQGLAVAIRAGATKAIFDSTIGIHPTAAEEFVTMREPTN